MKRVSLSFEGAFPLTPGTRQDRRMVYRRRILMEHHRPAVAIPARRAQSVVRLVRVLLDEAVHEAAPLGSLEPFEPVSVGRSVHAVESIRCSPMGGNQP